MKYISTALLLIVHFFCYAQDLEVVADSLHDIGKLDQALEIYQQQLNSAEEKEKIYYKIAENFSLQKQIDSAFHYLPLGLEKDSTEYPLGNPHFFYLIEDDRWDNIVIKQVKKLELLHGPYKHLEISKQLWKMHIIDQAYYYHWYLADDIDYNSPLRRAIMDLKEIHNKENQRQLEQIIEKYGYPTADQFGKMAAGTAFLIIQHADLEMQEKYISTIKTLCEKKIVDCQDFALMYDRIELRNGRKQLYGTQLTRDENEKLIPKPLKDEEYVEARRKQLGIFSLKQYFSYFGEEYNFPQKELPEK